MMNPAKDIGALSNIPAGMEAPQGMPSEGMQQASMADMGYPSNLAEEDKVFIIQRMMQLANEPNNPYLSGDSGMQMLLMEKYGVGK
jgi:hypothetical protein